MSLSFNCLLILPFCVHANADFIGTHQNRLSVVTENWYPFNYKSEDNEIIGISTGHVNKVLEHAKIPFEITMNTWQRSYNLARSQKDVLLYTIVRTTAREKLFHWFCPISHPPGHSVYKLRNRNDIVVSNENELKNYTLSVHRSTFSHEHFLSKGFVKGQNLAVSSSNEANVRMLLKGRVDLIVISDLAIESILMLNDANLEMVEIVYTIPQNELPPSCMALNKDSSLELVEKIRTSHEFILSQE